MDWTMIDPLGSFYCLGEKVDGGFEIADDADEVLTEMLEALEEENHNSHEVRRRMGLDKIVETDIIPLLKDCDDLEIFAKAIKLLVNLTQPLDKCPDLPASIKNQVMAELSTLNTSCKQQCSDVSFFKSIVAHMRNILDNVHQTNAHSQCLNHCVLLLRNLFHIQTAYPGLTTTQAHSTSQGALLHQCLLSSFFMNELDQIILAMMNHHLKQIWTIGLAQLISFMFKVYSASLLEPDIDDMSSASSSAAASPTPHQQSKQQPGDITDRDRADRQSTGSPGGSEQNLNALFKDELQLNSQTSSSHNSQSSYDDDFMLQFTTDQDGKLEIKMTNCLKTQKGEPRSDGAAEGCVGKEGSDGRSDSLEDMDVKDSEEISKSPASNNHINSDNDKKLDELEADAATEERFFSSLNPGSTLMDKDILISYLKKFASDILGSSFVELVKNILKCMVSSAYSSIMDHSFLMWTVGFFLSFAHQQDLDFNTFKEVLNLDLFGYLVYEGVVCCEQVQVKVNKGQDCAVEKHRLHLVVCTLNQMFRALLTNSKSDDYLQNLLRCMGQISGLRDLFVLLLCHYQSDQQSIVYLRDVVQTNHVMMLMLEELMSHGVKTNGLSLLEHVSQFATKDIMGKYGNLVDNPDGIKEKYNVAALTMMYHVAGDCGKKDTLMQLPIINAFFNMWQSNAIKDADEVRDLVEFILEMFMSAAENNPESLSLLAPGSPDSGHSEENSGEAGNPDSQMSAAAGTNEGASGAVDDLSEEEQSIVFHWLAEMGTMRPGGRARLIEQVTRRLADLGFIRTPKEVTKYLEENGFIEDLSVVPEQPSTASSEEQNVNMLTMQISGMPAEQSVPLLADRLRQQGYQAQLQYVQQQLLETAYVKLALKYSAMRVHAEEPVPKFFALQNKAVPLVPWNELIQEALAKPEFVLLNKSLGLLPPDGGDCVFYRIPAHLSPVTLVNKACLIGSIDSSQLRHKFNVADLMQTTDLSLSQDEDVSDDCGRRDWEKPRASRSGANNNTDWLNFVQKNNVLRRCEK